MKNTLHLGALALLMLFACNKDEVTYNGPEQAPAFSLSDPQPGQVARFERIHLAAADSLPTKYRDTLLLEVINVADGHIEVEERLSNGSISQFGTSAVPFPGHAFTYRLSAKPEALNILSNEASQLESRLFPSLSDQSHSLAYTSNSTTSAELEGLRVQTPYLPVDRTYNIHLRNQTLIANLKHNGRQDGLPGFTFVHDREAGLDFMLVEFDLEGNASGWKLIK